MLGENASVTENLLLCGTCLKGQHMGSYAKTASDNLRSSVTAFYHVFIDTKLTHVAC